MKGCLYLETIAQYHREAKKLLGDKDQHGMRLNGIIILINGEEPGQGKTSLFDYRINPGDVIEIVYKNRSEERRGKECRSRWSPYH